MIKQKLDAMLRLIDEEGGADELILTDPYDMGYLLGYEDAFATIATRDSITVIAPVLDYYRAREMLESDVTVLGYASYKMNAPDDIK